MQSIQSHSRAFARLSQKTSRLARKRQLCRQLATAVDINQKVGWTWLCTSQTGYLTLTHHQDPTELDQITTLPNGIRVATESLPGPFAGVGVYLDAGSRYEDEEVRGVSHIVDRLAFKVCAHLANLLA